MSIIGGFKNGLIKLGGGGIVPADIQYNRPILTGADISYNLYDDNWQTVNGIKQYPVVANPIHTAALDCAATNPFTTLINNNIFGNLDRLTTNTGTQDYTDTGGGFSSDGSISDYIVDNLTGFAWTAKSQGSANFANSALNAFNSTFRGFTDWFVPDRYQLETIMNGDFSQLATNNNWISYAPFVVSSTIWSSTTSSNTTQGFYSFGGMQLIGILAKTTATNSHYYRVHF